MTDAWMTAVEADVDLCDVADIPLLGVVAAGAPYHAFPVEETLAVPTTLWAGRQVFALRVRGSSMIDEGIHNGDYLIVEPRAVAENGQTVVAEIDGGVTVKKYFRDTDGQVRLQPANSEMLPLRIRGDQVRIIGVVAGVVRKFGFGDRAPAVPPAVRAAAHASRHLSREEEAASLELAVNVIDRQLSRWETAITHARQDRHLRRHLARMEELDRDLRALRDWCTRTQKPGLRRALLAEANAVIRRMQRFASVTPVQLPDLVLH